MAQPMHRVGQGTFEACLSACAALGESLACIGDGSDFASFRAASKDVGPAWFGFFQWPNKLGEYNEDVTGWELPDGTPKNWAAAWCHGTWSAPWSPGEPNDYKGMSEDCAIAGLSEQPNVWDAPCTWDGPACICQAPPAGYVGNITVDATEFLAAQGLLAKAGEEGKMVGQWVDFGVRQVTSVLALGLFVVFMACLLCRSCSWRRHVESYGPAKTHADALAPRECCGRLYDHAAARAADPTGRACHKVDTRAFECLRGVAALQVMIGHFFSFWAPNLWTVRAARKPYNAGAPQHTARAQAAASFLRRRRATWAVATPCSCSF